MMAITVLVCSFDGSGLQRVLCSIFGDGHTLQHSAFSIQHIAEKRKSQLEIPIIAIFDSIPTAPNRYETYYGATHCFKKNSKVIVWQSHCTPSLVLVTVSEWKEESLANLQSSNGEWDADTVSIS